MSNGYRIKLLKIASGERFPLLMDGNGQPLFAPTVYTMSELRGRNQATNTISSNLRAIQILHYFIEWRGIDLDKRLSSGKLFSLAEIEELTRFCRLPMGYLESLSQIPINNNARDCPRSMEKARMRLDTHTLKEIDPLFAGTRIRYIRAYLEWLALEHCSRHRINQETAQALKDHLPHFCSAITARIPKGKKSQSMGLREGLDPDVAKELLQIASPQNHKNPWQGDFVRHRNELIIHWLYYLGLRRGELLGVRIKDIDFREGVVTIHRRADDALDPRVNQPQSKTKARQIPLSEGLQLITHEYVIHHRAHLKGATKHDFLLCADVTGHPMSLPALNKVFGILREKCPHLPASLSPHVLRHTWNDRFSEEMDKRKTPEESEKKIRSYLMGWSETSGTAATYTRRHTRKKAQEIALEMQQQIKGEEKEDV